MLVMCSRVMAGLPWAAAKGGSEALQAASFWESLGLERPLQKCAQEHVWPELHVKLELLFPAWGLSCCPSVLSCI